MDKTDSEWREFCRPYVHMNGSHEMPNYAAICRAALALAPKPWHYTEGGVETIDLDRSMWEEVKAAARESKWMPPEYMMNDWVSDVCSWLKGPRAALTAVDVVMHCPSCHAQHVDAPKACTLHECEQYGRCYAEANGAPERCDRWDNPPHRSHLCAKCDFQWRPSDVPTNGVAAVTTKGAYDSPLTNIAGLAEDVRRYRKLRAQHWSDSAVFVVSDPSKSAVAVGTNCPSGEKLDALIDALPPAPLTGMPNPVEELRGLLEEAHNGLKWYRDAHPEDDSQADDELYARIEAALAPPEGKRS